MMECRSIFNNSEMLHDKLQLHPPSLISLNCTHGGAIGPSLSSERTRNSQTDLSLWRILCFCTCSCFMISLQNTQYKAEYHRYHPTIKFFWDVFHDLSLEDKKKFLCK